MARGALSSRHVGLPTLRLSCPALGAGSAAQLERGVNSSERTPQDGALTALPCFLEPGLSQDSLLCSFCISFLTAC